MFVEYKHTKIEIRPITFFIGYDGAGKMDIIDYIRKQNICTTYCYPENNMHPKGQLNLIEDILTIRNICIATNSEVFILRTRLKISKGEIPPEEVIIYYVEKDKITPISIDMNGHVDWWPRDFFSQSYHEVTALRRQQQNK